ncbi:PAS domain S-box protein [Roseofilum capinflatum]|uniref:histidine kinase n=1 Tax=Roseofilum capinflatum BLCC-M114 TaxID=3022440 RepID=A0ABT7B658_9CYAN|nr:PAS domain S-box protein [Roseofilum capinflatum]MDJ1174655.1 PAS domain S-box protein [Roseofilum capinflatum BLCC-M114]
MSRPQQRWIEDYTILLEEYLQEGEYPPKLEEWIQEAIAAQIPLSTLSRWHHQSLSQFLQHDLNPENWPPLLDKAATFQSHSLNLYSQTWGLTPPDPWQVLGQESTDIICTDQKELGIKLKEWIEFEHLMSRLCTQFIHLNSHELDREIEAAIGHLAQHYDCDRAYLFQLVSDRQIAQLRYQWHHPEISPLPPFWHQIPMELTPWWREHLQKQQTIAINALQDFPPEAKAEQAIASAIQTQSLLLIPLIENDDFIGYLGFATIRATQTWTKDRITQLKWASELLTHTLKRQRAELTLEHLREQMEQHIEQRTQELQQVNHQLQAEIRERYQIEKALRQSEVRFRHIFEDSPLGIAILNRESGLERVNLSLCRMLGYSSLELQSLNLVDLLHPDDQELARKLLRRLMNGEIPSFQVKQRCIHQTQDFLWVKLIASVISTADPWGQASEPTPAYGIVIVENISKRKQAEETLQLIQFTLNRVMDAVLLVDARGQLIYVNDRACQTLEYSRDQLLQMKISQIDRSYSPQSWPLYWQEVKQSGFLRLDSTYETQSGLEIPVEINLNFFQYKGLEYSCAIARDLRDRQKAEAALQKSQQLLSASQKAAGLGSWEFDLLTQEMFWSEEVFRIFGQDPSWDRPPTYAQHIRQYHPDDRAQFQALVEQAISQGQEYDFELRILRSSGEVRTVWAQGQVVFNDRAEPIKLFGLIQDITDRKQVELALKENERRYRTLVSHIPGIIYRCLPNRDWTIEFINDAIESIIGYSAEEMMSGIVPGIAVLLHPEDLPWVQEEVDFALEQHCPFELEYRMIARDGSIRWVYEKGQGVWNDQQELVYLDGAIFDVSDRKQAEAQLKASLAEKEVLLREIHHRVKNNLNIIYSLLDMQSRQVSDPALHSLLLDSQKRLKTMALIHEKLYCSKSLSRIDFAEYIHSLVLSISASYGMRSHQIHLDIDADPVQLNIETAIPTGLIINELVTNAFKHAFPGDREGTVWIEFREIDHGQLDLKIVDNGVGLPSEARGHSSSLGMRLVYILADQLDADLQVQSENGTRFHLKFEQSS